MERFYDKGMGFLSLAGIIRVDKLNMFQSLAQLLQSLNGVRITLYMFYL